MNRLQNAWTEGKIVCQLYWDGKQQAIVELPAVPQIGSELMLEGTNAQGDETLSSYHVKYVGMTVKPMRPQDYEGMAILPSWACYVKVYLDYVGPASYLPEDEN